MCILFASKLVLVEDIEEGTVTINAVDDTIVSTRIMTVIDEKDIV